MSQPHDKREAFLRRASRGLAVVSPSIAAHIMSQHIDVEIMEMRKLRHKQDEKYCIACGTGQIPGWNSSIQIKSRAFHQVKRNSIISATKHNTRKMQITRTCDRCYRKQTTTLTLSKSGGSEEPSQAGVHPKPIISKSSYEPTIKEEKVMTKDSKKRDRRNRAKKLKLEALIDQSRRPEVVQSTTFDLMDFMKS